MPTPDKPCEPIQLCKGFNLISVCLLLTASLVGSTIFSQPLWLDGYTLSPGISVLSGPIALSDIPSTVAPGFHLPHVITSPRPTTSHKRPQLSMLCNPVVSDWHGANKFNDFDPEVVYHTQILVRSNARSKVTLPFNAFLGSIRPKSDADIEVHSNAAEFTASKLANLWHEVIQKQHESSVINQSISVNLAEDGGKSELSFQHSPRRNSAFLSTQSGLNSSILSPFSDSSPVEPDHALPPLTKSTVDISSI